MKATEQQYEQAMQLLKTRKTDLSAIEITALDYLAGHFMMNDDIPHDLGSIAIAAIERLTTDSQ